MQLAISTLCFLAISPRGSKYIVKSLGPKTEPCGTPNFRYFVSDTVPSITTLNLLPVRYDLDQLRQLPVIPNWLPSGEGEFYDRSCQMQLSSQVTLEGLTHYYRVNIGCRCEFAIKLSPWNGCIDMQTA